MPDSSLYSTRADPCSGEYLEKDDNYSYSCMDRGTPLKNLALLK